MSALRVQMDPDLFFPEKGQPAAPARPSAPLPGDGALPGDLPTLREPTSPPRCPAWTHARVEPHERAVGKRKTERPVVPLLILLPVFAV
jgi:hypothetical protein